MPNFRLGDEFAGQSKTRGQVAFIGNQADELGGLRTRVFSSIANAPDREIRGIRNAASLATQNQFGDQQTGAVRQGDIVSNALRRAKTRVGISNRGDAAVRNQQLRDRLTQVRSGIRGSARSLREQVTGRNIKAGVNVGVTAARGRASASNAGLVGSVLGGVTGTLKGNLEREGSTGIFDFGKPGPGIFGS